jgi:hypothetical protein
VKRGRKESVRLGWCEGEMEVVVGVQVEERRKNMQVRRCK